MKHVRLLLTLMLLVLAMVALVACGEGTPPPEDTELTVVLTVPEGVTVTSENPVKVKAGESASFTVTLPERTIFKSATVGTFDATTGTLTVEEVTDDLRIALKVEEVDYDTTVDVRYLFNGTAADTTSVPGNSYVKFGTQITVRAGESDDIFVGWVFENDPDRIVSTAQEFTFRVTPDVAVSSVVGYRVRLTPKYIRIGTYAYDANGGTVRTDTPALVGNPYVRTDISAASQGVLRMTLSKSYLAYTTCATALWNDGTFTRAGYVLKEYNTKPDGTGEPYSPGSKFYPLAEDGGVYTLYCIWEPFAAGEFTYESVSMDYPATLGGKTSYAAHWRVEGVRITGYTGDSETVAIPDTLGGKPVIAIGAGAIRDKAMTTLVLPRTVQRIEDGAIVGCDRLTTLYYPNSIYEISDAALDTASYTSLKTLVVTATMAPREATNEYGDFSVKLARVLSTMDRNRLIIISGSSTYQGLSTPYMEALLDGSYAVINLGTTRTAHCALYLEAIGHYTHEGDIVIYSPENSTFLMGDRTLYWKTFRDLDGMNNIYRYVDISHYTDPSGEGRGIFTAFSRYNQGVPFDEQKVTAYYAKPPVYYEQIVERAGKMNKYGDDIAAAKEEYVVDKRYLDVYTVTLNEYMRNHNEGTWSKSEFQNDYRDATYWSNVLDEPYRSLMRHAVAQAKAGGARVYFGFAPTDNNALIAEVDAAHLARYDTLFATAYGFDGAIGKSTDFIYDHRYFYDCAFHTNNYGRAIHTYALYRELCETLGVSVKHTHGDLGTSFAGCLFETDSRGAVLTSPKYPMPR